MITGLTTLGSITLSAVACGCLMLSTDKNFRRNKTIAMVLFGVAIAVKVVGVVI